MAQQARSHFRAQVFVRLRKGVGGGDGDGERLMGMFAFCVMQEEGVSTRSSRVAEMFTNE
jgi:hypothetical protein